MPVQAKAAISRRSETRLTRGTRARARRRPGRGRRPAGGAARVSPAGLERARGRHGLWSVAPLPPGPPGGEAGRRQPRISEARLVAPGGARIAPALLGLGGRGERGPGRGGRKAGGRPTAGRGAGTYTGYGFTTTRGAGT